MNIEARKTFTSWRWILLYITLGMMAVGYIGGKTFEHLNRLYPPSTPRNMFDGTFDLPVFLCISLYFAGMILCVVCSIWILAMAILSNGHSKKDIAN